MPVDELGVGLDITRPSAVITACGRTADALGSLIDFLALVSSVGGGRLSVPCSATC